jgi:branched-chain amino acid transport system ATP-binding protein
VLSLDGVHAAYGLSEVLFGVSLEVREGEVVSLLARNGAGKSTTLRCIMGLLRPTAGSVRFRGEDLVGLPPHQVCRRGIGWVPEDRRIFKELTVLENLEVGRRPGPRGEPRWTVERVLAVFPLLGPLRARRAGTLSGGEQQMLTIARTLMGNPDLLLLDEPSEGLAPVLVQALQQQVLALKAGGQAILLSEQNLKFVGPVADRAYIIEKGRVVWSGPMAELLARDDVRRAHLELQGGLGRPP